MGMKLMANVECDLCGEKKSINVSRLPWYGSCGELLSLILETHGYRKHGDAWVCDECLEEFRTMSIQP